MATERNTQKIYANEVKSQGTGNLFYRTDTLDLQDLIDNVGRFVSVSVFFNEREVNGEMKRSSTLMVNESDAKYMKRKDGAQAQSGASEQPSGGRTASVRRV